MNDGLYHDDPDHDDHFHNLETMHLLESLTHDQDKRDKYL